MKVRPTSLKQFNGIMNTLIHSPGFVHLLEDWITSAPTDIELDEWLDTELEESLDSGQTGQVATMMRLKNVLANQPDFSKVMSEFRDRVDTSAYEHGSLLGLLPRWFVFLHRERLQGQEAK